VVLAYGSQLHRFLARRLRSNEDAADLAQEVYLRLLRLPRTDLIRKPVAYVYFVASQVAAEHRMRERDRPIDYDTESLERLTSESAFSCPEQVAESLDIDRELKRLLGKLAETHRNVLILKKRDGLSTREIAQALSLSEHTVKKYLFQAMAKIAVMRKGKKVWEDLT
jgi:RNA polymerase sigma-70 factor (ECF subfamily)